MTSAARWLTVIGIGEDGLDGLSAVAREALAAADILVGGRRQLAMVPDNGRERIAWESPLTTTLNRIMEMTGRPVVVLATGNPMWFGIGATLSRSVPAAEMRVIPAPSAFSLAAGRLGWPISEVECLTLHGRAIDRVRYFLSPNTRMIILSHDGETPGRVAAILRETGFGKSTISVLTHMSGPEEYMFANTADEWESSDVPDLNTIAVHCQSGPESRALSRMPGLPDDAFSHDGTITKREVRASTLASLAPLPGQLLWDVGAGHGTISIEWMRSDVKGTTHAVAIEQNADRLNAIRDNALALGVPNLEIVDGKAPGVLEELDPPDAVFIGGGLSTTDMLETCWNNLKPGGRLVANSVTFEGEKLLMEWAETTKGELIRFDISHGSAVGSFKSWDPAKPVTQLRAIKK